MTIIQYLTLHGKILEIFFQVLVMSGLRHIYLCFFSFACAEGVKSSTVGNLAIVSEKLRRLPALKVLDVVVPTVGVNGGDSGVVLIAYVVGLVPRRAHVVLPIALSAHVVEPTRAHLARVVIVHHVRYKIVPHLPRDYISTTTNFDFVSVKRKNWG